MNKLPSTKHAWVWTDERIAQLRKLEAKLYSASDIAAEMGTTKNTITGKLSRLGLRRRKPQGFIEPPPPKKFIPRNDPSAPGCNLNHVQILDAPKNVMLTELEHHHCRWPMDLYVDDIPVFCGLRKENGSAYCAGHSRWAAPRR